MASLRKRPESNNWVCCFTLNDGERTQRSTGQSDRSKAMMLCLEWEKAAKDARAGNFSEAQSRKLLSSISERAGLGTIDFASTKQFLMEWVESKEVTKAAGTTRRYRFTIEEFIAHLGKRADLSLASVRPKDISGYRDGQIKQGKSASTANMAVKTLRVPFNLARRQGIILTNPAEAVELLPSDAATRTTFTREQIKAMLAVADIEWQGMILFGACHGLRISDAARLSWPNINAERQTLRFVAEKTRRGTKGKGEEYPLHPDIVTYLENLKVGDNLKAFLFPSLYNKKSGGVSGLSLIFRKVMAKAGVHAEEESEAKPKGKGRRFFSLGFHSLRHTAISEQANQGVTKEIRMKLSGHRSEVHERYTHHELEVLRREIEKVPSFL